MGALLKEFNKTVLPLSSELDKLINTPNLAVTEDFTIIPINIKKNGQTVRVYENGILLECYHERITNNNCNDCGEFVEHERSY